MFGSRNRLFFPLPKEPRLMSVEEASAVVEGMNELIAKAEASLKAYEKMTAATKAVGGLTQAHYKLHETHVREVKGIEKARRSLREAMSDAQV